MPINLFSRLNRIFFLLIPFSLCFSERLNTFMLMGYGVTILLQRDLPGRFRRALTNGWLYPLLGLFLWHGLSLCWSSDLNQGLFVLEKKASLLFIPLFVAMDARLNGKGVQEGLWSLVIGCVTALWICLGYGVWQYIRTGESGAFFYHRLGWVLDEFNAIYFSLYVFMGMVSFGYLSTTHHSFFQRKEWLRTAIPVTLATGMILLSSRLFISLALAYGLWLLWRHYGTRAGEARRLVIGRTFVLALLVVAGLLTGVARNRFQELLHSHFEVLRQEQYNWDTPFNGLTLRLVFLKFGWEILRDNHAFLWGVGIGDAQNEMNRTIVRHNLYHGNPELGDRGFLDYNFHNQYMELWVQTGLVGLAGWLVLLVLGFCRGFQAGLSYPLLFLLVCAASLSFTECLLERQRGIVFFTFFLSLFYTGLTNGAYKISHNEATG